MLKLVRTDADELYINDGEIILSRWIADSHHESVIIRDAYGGLIVREKVSASNPIETDQGERTSASDVINDIGSNWRTRGFGNYYQWVFLGKSAEIITKNDLWYYKNYGSGGSDADLQITDTQVCTFDSIAYITIDLTGLTIASYEGTAIPTKTNDSRIDITTGQIYSITLSNGYVWYANEGQGSAIDFTDSNSGVLTGIINGGTEAAYWANKSDNAYPALLRYGGSKYLVCESSGVTALDVTEGTGVPISAYGEWEGKFWRNSAIASDYIAFISDGTDPNIQNQGYLLFLSSTGSIAIRKGVTGTYLLRSPVGYIDLFTYYKYRIQRNELEDQYFTGAANSMRLLIKGGSFLDWTIVDSSVAGSNPFIDSTYTTYKYQSSNLTLSTEISHLSKDGVKIDVSDFQTVSGTFCYKYIIGSSSTKDAKDNILEYPPNCLWPSGSTLKQPSGDVGLFALSKAYTELDIQYGATENDPLKMTFAQLNAIDVTVDPIPKADFVIDNMRDDGCIKNMASAPYDSQPLRDVNGVVLFDSNGEKLYPLKEF